MAIAFIRMEANKEELTKPDLEPKKLLNLWWDPRDVTIGLTLFKSLYCCCPMKLYFSKVFTLDFSANLIDLLQELYSYLTKFRELN